MKTIGNLKDSVAGILQGTNLNNVTNLNGAIERAARVLSQQADTPDATGRENYLLYSGVYDYPAPTNIFGGAFIDLRPQGVSRNPWDTIVKRPIELFDRTKLFAWNGTEVTFEWNLGTPIMRVAGSIATQNVLIDRMDDADDWTAGGTLSGLETDSTIFYQAPSGLRFTLTGSGTGTLTRTLTNSIDISSYEDVGMAFVAIRIPDGATATDLTSVSLKLGSNSTNYDSVTSTEAFLGAWTEGDYVLVPFDFSAATTTGTPDWSAIDYVQVSFATTSTLTNFRAGGVFIAMPSAYELLYQTSAIFLRDGALTSTIESDDDEIVLNDASYTLFEYITANEIAIQSGGMVSQGVIERLKGILYDRENGLLPRYRADNPSEELRQIGSYYDVADY